MTEFHMLRAVAMSDELEKIALDPKLMKKITQRAMSGVGTASLGGAAGAVGGAALGAWKDPVEGESRLQNAVSGAGRGALLGAAAGGAAGAIAGPKALRGLQHSDGIAGSIHRTGQRVVHGVTGLSAEGGQHAMRGGSWDARKRVADLTGQHVDSVRRVTKDGALEEAAGKIKGVGDVAQAHKGMRHAMEAEKAGLTSLPGYVKAMRRDGIGKTLATDAKAQWHSSDGLGKALMVGMPAVGVAGAMTAPEAKGRLGEGKGEHYGRVAGNLVSAPFGAVMPFAGAMGLQEATTRAGQYVGRGVDAVARKAKGQPAGTVEAPTAAMQQG